MLFKKIKQPKELRQCPDCGCTWFVLAMQFYKPKPGHLKEQKLICAKCGWRAEEEKN